MKSLAFILLVITVIGLARPKLVLPFLKDKSRKKVLLYYGVTFAIILILAGQQSDPAMNDSVMSELGSDDDDLGKRIFNEIMVLEREARSTSETRYPVFGSELREGSLFVLSQETRLMNELSPEDEIEAVGGLILLKVGTVIEVLKSIDSPRSFRVKVKSTNQEGSILSSALDAQKVANSDEVLSQRMGLFYRLKEQADSIVLAKYGLTQNQLDSLELVGIKLGWNN